MMLWRVLWFCELAGLAVIVAVSMNCCASLWADGRVWQGVTCAGLAVLYLALAWYQIKSGPPGGPTEGK